jgi:hypothetical protein
MPTPLVVVWWLWVGVSVTIWTRRLLRKASGRRSVISVAAPSASPAVPTPVAAPAAAPAAAPIAGVPAAPPPPAGPRPAGSSIAGALAGISMPCELTPFFRREFADDHVAFVTDGHDAGAVRDALTAELEGLGMDVRALTDTVVMAKRDAITVRVTLHPGPTGAADRFPSLPVGRVVVEFELLASQPAVS